MRSIPGGSSPARRSAWRVRSSGDSLGRWREVVQNPAFVRHHSIGREDSGRPQANPPPFPPPPQRSSRPCPPRPQFACTSSGSSSPAVPSARLLPFRTARSPPRPKRRSSTSLITFSRLMKRFIELTICYSYWPWGGGPRTPPGSDQATIIVAPSAAPAIVTRWGTDAGKLLHLVEHLLGPSRCKPCSTDLARLRRLEYLGRQILLAVLARHPLGSSNAPPVKPWPPGCSIHCQP